MRSSVFSTKKKKDSWICVYAAFFPQKEDIVVVRGFVYAAFFPQKEELVVLPGDLSETAYFGGRFFPAQEEL